MTDSALPWTRKYRPSSLSEVQGQNAAAAKMKSYVESFNHKKPKAAILYGPPGSGKTCSVYALAEDLDLEVVEVNASDTRNKGSLNDLLGPAIQQRSLFSKGKLVLVDEIDGLSGRKDRGGVSALQKLLKTSGFPIILTANDPWDRKFSSLRRKCEMIKFNTLSYRSVAAVLRTIVEKEGIEADEQILERLSRRAGGDLRAAICDLQMLTAPTGALTEENLDFLSARDREESIMNALVRVFKSTDMDVAWGAFDAVPENPEECFHWVHENLPREYTKPLDLYRAYESLSRADIHNGRIRRWQYYRLWLYLRASTSIGVALAKDEKYPGFTKYSRPQRGLTIWRANRANKLRDAIAERIAEQTHTSARVARLDTLPYIREIFRRGKGSEEAKNLISSLELSKEERAWLAKI